MIRIKGNFIYNLHDKISFSIIKVEFNSYIIPQNEIENNNFRLLDVDNRAALPINTFVRIIITATDVLHS